MLIYDIPVSFLSVIEYIWIFNSSFHSFCYHPKWVIAKGTYYVAKEYSHSPPLGVLVGVLMYRKECQVSRMTPFLP